MDAGTVAVRLLEIDAPDADGLVDAALAEAVTSATGAPGLRRLILAERVTESGREVALLTIWNDEAAMAAAVAEGTPPVYHVALARYLGTARLSVIAPDPGSVRLSPDAVASLSIAWDADLADVDVERSSFAIAGTVDGTRVAINGSSDRRRPDVAAIVGQIRRVAGGARRPAAEFLVTADVSPLATP